MSKRIIVPVRAFVVVVLLGQMFVSFATKVSAQTATLQQVLEQIDPEKLVNEARLRGDSRRGAIVFHTSAAVCVKCHQSGEGKSPLGPDLARLGDKITEVHLVESLLLPSKSIREGFQTVQVLTTNGQSRSGMLVREDAVNIVLRDADNLQAEITIAKDEIEARSNSKLSMMPEGLVSSLKSQREFLDLLSYLFTIQAGGPARAEDLKPSPEQLNVKDDTVNLNHAKIIQKVEDGKLKRGQRIYEASCIQCHGADGNTPSLATVSNPDYKAITEQYLESLPKGSEMGEFEPAPDRDYGPALASQLGREVNSALTVKLGEMSIAYDLQTMDQAGIWSGGFLDVEQTQHKRGRGEGYPTPKGKEIENLSVWKWGHDGKLDYSQENVLPRGPLAATYGLFLASTTTY